MKKTKTKSTFLKPIKLKQHCYGVPNMPIVAIMVCLVYLHTTFPTLFLLSQEEGNVYIPSSYSSITCDRINKVFMHGFKLAIAIFKVIMTAKQLLLIQVKLFTIINYTTSPVEMSRTAAVITNKIPS